LTLIRKVFWPAAIALGLLVFLGAIGQSGIVRTASADDGDYCKVLGPTTIQVGGHYLYVGVLDKFENDHGHTVSIDNIVGNSKITSAVKDDDNYDTSVGPSNLVSDLPAHSAFDLDDNVVDDLAASFAPDGTPGTGMDIFASQNVCGNSTVAALTRIINDAILDGSVCAVVTSGSEASNVVNSCLIFGGFGTSCAVTGTTSPNCFTRSDRLYQDGDIDCPTGSTCTIPSAVITAVAAAVAADLLAGHDCRDISIDAAKAAVGAGASELVGLQFGDFFWDACRRNFDFRSEDSFLDSFVIVDVTCNTAGNFDITFTDENDEADSMSLSVKCLGAPSSKSTITATPPSIEIAPSVGNTSVSLINVNLLDSDGNQAGTADVDFLTDRCSVESASVDTVAEWNVIAPLFGAINVSVPSTSAAVQASAAATTQPDSARTQDSMLSIDLGTSTRAGTILLCDPLAAPGATPGVATITAIVDSKAAGVTTGTGNDVVLSVKVTVVGPPATITVAASPSSVRCGEKATITATVKDAIGQNVSEHTRVEAVTNAGGVLAGTGAVANQAGLVSPISSTVSETFSGVSTFFLLTSEQHTGPYEVVVTSGGSGALGSALGGVFSTPPVSAQATVTCTLPAAPSTNAPAPTVTAPRTGTGGITPPNTGDAGLAASNGSSLTLFAASMVAGLALAGVVVFKKKGING
jgi:hypothetical protein